MTRTSSFLSLIRTLPLLVLAGGCSPLAIAQVTDYEVIGDAESDSTSSSSSGSADETTGDTEGESEGTSEGEGTTDATASATQGEEITAGPTLPPEILEVVLTPTPILHHGPVFVEVSTAAADGVALELEDGSAFELDDLGGGSFSGEIPVLSGFENGEHTATLRPWRGDLTGEDVLASYVIDLATPGSEMFWETGDLIGAGSVAALGVLPDGDLLELGTRQVDGKVRCYLRRRDKIGGWWEDDVIDLVAGELCSAVDLKIREDGSIYVLLDRYINNSSRWWLGEIAVWGGPVKSLRLGGPDETAVALAITPGAVAICGSTPTGGEDKIDAATWVLSDQTWDSRVFDYRPLDNDKKHLFAEKIHDCVYSGDALVLSGAVFGRHESEWDPAFDRHLLIEVSPGAEKPRWTIASGEQAAQSNATALTLDDQGRILTAGYTCDEACDKPSGDLRIYDAVDGLIWQAPLGSWPTEAFAPHDLEWSPAGYAVVATGGTSGEETSFSVRAFDPYKMDPVWTFSRTDAQMMHMAEALAIGPYGEVYAGGWGATGYPAIAYIGG